MNEHEGVEKRLAAAEALRQAAREVVLWGWQRFSSNLPNNLKRLQKAVFEYDAAVMAAIATPEELGPEGAIPWDEK